MRSWLESTAALNWEPVHEITVESGKVKFRQLDRSRFGRCGHRGSKDGWSRLSLLKVESMDSGFELGGLPVDRMVVVDGRVIHCGTDELEQA